MADLHTHTEFDTGFPDRAKEWIDERVYGAGKAATRGGMQVMSSGFGKGLLVAAAIVAIGMLIGSIITPGLMFGAPFAGISVAQSVDYALPSIGNFLLGSGAGLATLAGGGAVGSLVAAHKENTRIGKEAAETQAAYHAHLREAHNPQPTVAKAPEQEGCNELEGGHCARLMREQKEQREAAR